MRRLLDRALTLFALIGVLAASVAAEQWDPLKRIREKAEQLKSKIECAVNDPRCADKAPAAPDGQPPPPTPSGPTTGAGPQGFGTAPEPDIHLLFKLFVAANADGLDSDDIAVDYHYLFVPPNSKECTTALQKAHNDVARQELIAAARASFARVRAEAASWPKTAVVRMRFEDRLGEYNAAAGGFRLTSMPLAYQPGPERVLGIGRSAGGMIYQRPVPETCLAGHALLNATIPTLFQLEFTGAEHIPTVPMDKQTAEAYVQRNTDKRIAVEVLAEIGPVLVRPTDAGTRRGAPVRVIAARALDPRTGAVVHDYQLAGQTSAAQTASAAPAPGSQSAFTPSAATAVPSQANPASTSTPASSGQSAAIWQGDFAAVPEPSHRALLELFVAANPDLLDDDANAWEGHVLLNVPPGTNRTDGRAGAPSPECLALEKQFANEVTRPDLLKRTRAEFQTQLAAASSWPKTAVFRLRIRDLLNEYDAATGSFPLHTVPRLLAASTAEVKIARTSVHAGLGLYPGPMEFLCDIQIQANYQRRVPRSFEFDVRAKTPIDRVPMGKGAAEAYLDAHRGALYDRRIDIDLIVEVGPLTPKPDNRRSFELFEHFRVDGRVIAARALDPVNGRVVHENLLQAGSTTTVATAGTQSAAGSTPVPASPAASQLDMAGTPRAPAGPEPLTRWRVGLLTLRHLPELLTDKLVVDFATRLIQDEQAIWARLDQLAKAPRPEFNKKRLVFAYEWQKAIESQPDFARGALLDVFMKPDADWSFVKREREWDERFTAAVGAFVFARDRIEGRQPGFAAQGLAPVARRHLEAAAASAHTALWFPLKLPSWDYDFAAQAIQFRTGEPLQTPKGWFDEDYTVMPASAATTANHAAIGTMGAQLSEPKEPRPGLPEPSGTEKWRYQLQLFAQGPLPNYGALALDRGLFLKSIAMDPKIAERLALTRAELHAKVYITATGVELGESRIDGKPRKFAVLFATLHKVDIYTSDNELVATVKPEALPAPRARSTDPPAPAPKPAAKQPPGPDAAEVARRQEIERQEASHQILADLKTKAAIQLEQSTRAAQCMQQVLAVHPDQDSPAFKAAFDACMQGAPAVPVAAAAFGAPWRPCSEPLRSLESTTVVYVEFVNLSGQPRNVYWLDFSGARQLYGVMQPGQRASMQTYVSHPWVVADASDTCLGTFMITRDTKRVEIR